MELIWRTDLPLDEQPLNNLHSVQMIKPPQKTAKTSTLRSKDCPILVVKANMSDEPRSTTRKAPSASQKVNKALATTNLGRT